MRSTIIKLALIAAAFGVIILCISPGTQQVRSGPRSQCKNNLRQIALALHEYHEQYGSFPPAVTRDAKGRPAHSWRVLILPFVEKSGLYREYRFDEPWNGPNNSKLAARIPRVYRCPEFNAYHHRHKLNSQHLKVLTNYVAIVAPNAIFNDERVTTFKDIPDGTESTILVAEVWEHAVHWMQPKDVSPHDVVTDLQYSAVESQSNHNGGLYFAFANGSVRSISADIDIRTFLALITRNGREPIPDDF